MFAGCFTFQQHASVSQRQICSDKRTCFHTEMEAADLTFYLTQSQYTDTGPTSPRADRISPDAWQGIHWSTSCQVPGMTPPGKSQTGKRDANQGYFFFCVLCDDHAKSSGRWLLGLAACPQSLVPTSVSSGQNCWHSVSRCGQV